MKPPSSSGAIPFETNPDELLIDPDFDDLAFQADTPAGLILDDLDHQ